VFEILEESIKNDPLISNFIDGTSPTFEMKVPGKIDDKKGLTPFLKMVFGKKWQAIYKYVSIKVDHIDDTENEFGNIKTKDSLRVIYTPM
jgi:hypothetical protein